MRIGYGLFALTLAACSGSTPTSYNGSPGGGSTAASVSVINTAYSPMDITVKMGTTITWTNDDQVGHTVTDDGGAFDASLKGGMTDPYGGTSGGGAFSHLYSTVGSYMYHCKIHSTMHGTVNVTQ
jgi:plastocyanin